MATTVATPDQLKEYRSSEFIDETFKFWFSDSEHLRSPMPTYIRCALRANATNQFIRWIGNLTDDAKHEINDEIVAEKFEEIIFEEATSLVLTEDEKLTIQYPFMPRCDDEINDQVRGKSKVVSRSKIKDGDVKYLKLKLITEATNESWETKFELPL